MTPKEKALSLCQHFGSTTKFAEDCNQGKTLPLRVAKLCAMIFVDGVLTQYKTGKFDYKILDEEESIYWENVKNEIESL